MSWPDIPKVIWISLLVQAILSAGAFFPSPWSTYSIYAMLPNGIFAITRLKRWAEA